MTGCTCLVGRTLTAERLQELDTALRMGSASLGSLASAYGLKKPTLGRHRLQCLGLTPQREGRFKERTPRESSGEDETGAETSHAAPETPRDDPPRARAESSKLREFTARAPSHETRETPSIGLSDLTDADPAALGVVGFASQVLFIADMLTTGRWKDRRSVKALGAAWGLGREAIHERHRAAAVLAGQDRGALAEQLENTIGKVTAAAEECEARAAALEAPVDSEGKSRPPSEDELALAVKYRTLAGKAWARRAQLEGLLTTRVSVSIEGDPRLAGFWPVLWAALAELDAARRRFIEQVEKLTGGALPAEPLPEATAAIEDAIRRYEAQIGARSVAPALGAT